MLSVSSEIGRLRRVLVHGPGAEVDLMVPAMMEELLFDDILFGEGARDEHARFRRVLQLLGVETLEARDLLAETLALPEAREWALEVLLEDLPWGVRERLEAADGDELISLLVEGIRTEGRRGVEADDLFRLTPLPNWCFQRDPQIVLGEGVVFSAMAASARHREALLARLVFRFHPELAGAEVIHDPLEHTPEHPLFLGRHRPRLEGGDLLVVSPEIVAVGQSERTNLTGIHSLARALARREDGPRWMLVQEIPKRRAYMHLDTLITPVDRDACLVYPPAIERDGSEQGSVYELDLHAREPEPEEREDLLSALARRGVDLEPIPCGGSDPVHQQREQWTDGANSLAVAPGLITLYDRNLRTAEELSGRGFRVVSAEDLLLGRTEVDPAEPGRVCVLLASHEVSRARGGPHCLTHPLEREPA
jgi:arginine deiminase